MKRAGIQRGLKVLTENKSAKEMIRRKDAIASLEHENFKLLLEVLYKYFPTVKFSGYVENIIPDEKLREELIKQNVFVRYKEGKRESYFIGSKGIDLVGQGKIEKLTKSVYLLTFILILLGIIQIVLVAIQLGH